jgi:hypothetical protein
MQQPFRSTVANFTPLGLEVLNPMPAWEPWLRLWETVVTLNTASPFALCDAYLLGEQAFGEDAAQAIVLNLVSRRRLQGALRVGKFWVLAPRKRNRRRKVSFTHHRVVTGLAMDSDAGFIQAAQLLDEAEADPEIAASDLEAIVRGWEPEADASAEDEVEFSVGSLEQRLIRYHRTGTNLKDDLPDDWSPEHALLSAALAEVDSCLNSVRNRAIGEPAVA